MAIILTPHHHDGGGVGGGGGEAIKGQSKAASKVTSFATRHNNRRMILPLRIARLFGSTHPADRSNSARRCAEIEDWAIRDDLLGQATGLPLLAEVTRLSLVRLDAVTRQARHQPPHLVPYAWPIFPDERRKLLSIQAAYPPTAHVRALARRLFKQIYNPSSNWHAAGQLPSAPQEDEVAAGLTRACISVAWYDGFR